MTAPPPIRRDVTVPLPPREAFALFTEGIDGWWPRRPGGPASPAPGARLRLDPGREGALAEERPGRPPRVWARVAVWEPGRRLVLTWSEGHAEGEEPSEVELRFTPVEEGTRVDLTHVALGPVAGPPWAIALQALRRTGCSGAASPLRGKVTVSR